MTLLERMRAASLARPDAVAIVAGEDDGQVTHAELWRRVDAITGWLAHVGVGAGDRVAVWAPNMPPVIGFALAAWQRGAIVVPLSPLAAPAEVASALADARAIFAAPSLVAAARSHARAPIVSLAESGDAIGLATVLAHAPAPAVACAPEAIAAWFASSGTTGLPKTVELSHANLAAATEQILDTLGELEPITLAVAPYFHILGFVVELLMPLARGGRIVTLARFDPAAFLALVQRHRVTYVAAPPPLAGFLAGDPRVAAHDLSSLRLLVFGGAPLPPAVHAAVAARLPGCAIGQGYGLTETSSIISCVRAEVGSPPGSVGWPVKHTELRFVDPESGEDRGDGPGELWVRGPQLMRGYRNLPEATAQTIDEAGWLRTGDLARRDPDGTLVIVERLKELIKVKGYQVAPAELEQLMVAHPMVADAAVTAVPDERLGERPIALVVPRAGVELDGDALRAWLAPQVAEYKLPSEFRAIAALPRTPSGKLLRRRVAALVLPASSPDRG